MPTTILVPQRPATRRATPRKTAARAKKPFKFELTAEDIALDHAISAAAARSLAARGQAAKCEFPVQSKACLAAEVVCNGLTPSGRLV